MVPSPSNARTHLPRSTPNDTRALDPGDEQPDGDQRDGGGEPAKRALRGAAERGGVQRRVVALGRDELAADAGHRPAKPPDGGREHALGGRDRRAPGRDEDRLTPDGPRLREVRGERRERAPPEG